MTLLLIPLLSSSALAGDFMDVWVTTAFEDTNVRAGPEANSPSLNFVSRGNSTFFENYDLRVTDDISRANLVLYKKSDSWFEGWWAEAALVLRYTPWLDPDETDDGVNVADDGSYVRIVRDLPGEKHNISLTGYAVDAGRWRLGYSYDLTWGAKDIFAFTVGAAPGARIQWQKDGSYAFAGLKTAVGDYVFYNEDSGYEETRNQTYYGLLAGGGVELIDKLKIEVGAGSFQQGQILNVSDSDSELYGELITAAGVSGQVSFRTRTDLDFITSGELRLYRNDADNQRDTYIKHVNIDGVGAIVQAEINMLSHNLLDPENEEQTVIEKGVAGDVQTLLVFGSTTVGADLVYKDLPFILFNIPGLTSGVALSEAIETTPQLYGRFAVSHFFPEAHTTPSLGVGLMRPATYTTSSGTYVQYSERDKEAVPDGQAATAILSGVAGVQVDVTPHVVTVAELLYTVDNNQSEAVVDEETGAIDRVLAPANERNMLGVNLMVRARF